MAKHPILGEQDYQSVRRVLEEGTLSGFRGSPDGHLGGKKVHELEDLFCDYFNVKYAVSMNSATACLHAAVIASSPMWYDEFIVSPYSFVSSASCVLMAHAIPKFIDIEAENFCIDPRNIKKNYNTKAIIPVHLCGHPADMDGIPEGLFVIEDAAQAIGAKYKGKLVGTIGDCGVFSFNQSKQISTGEGGVLITDNDDIARITRAIRNHGEISDPELKIIGYNYRMCEVEAALAIEQFKRLEENIAWRIELADCMTQKLKWIDGFTPPVTQPNCRHTFYTYAVKYDEDVVGMPRDTFQDRLMGKGVYFGKGYVKPLYLLPIFGGGMGECPVAERMWLRELMVTDILRPPLTCADVDDIVKKIKEVLSE